MSATDDDAIFLTHAEFSLLLNGMGEQWFVGANPWLDEISPIEAIKDTRAKDVMAAATAMTEDRFSG